MAGQPTKFNFTKAALEGLPPPPKFMFYRDEKIPGLALGVSPGGAKSFYYYRKWKGEQHQYKLGPFPEMTIDQARTKAIEANAALANGNDPRQVTGRPKKGKTFRELGEWWLEDYAKNKKETWKFDQCALATYLAPLTNQSLTSISQDDISKLHIALTKSNGPQIANKALELARAIFNRAIEKGQYSGPNPVLGLEWNETRSRDRRLMPEEMKAFFEALEAPETPADFRDFVLLSLFTGARQSNVMAMRWDQVDLTGRFWRIPKTKNGESQWIPLEDQEIEILSRRKNAVPPPWVFPSRSSTGHLVEPKNGWRGLLKRAGIDDLTMHDLRRTLGSYLVDTGASLEVIGQTLGHKSVAATKIYARLHKERLREPKARAIDEMMAHRNR